jgi:hypothetical protein
MDELSHAVQRAVYTEVDRAADEARRASVRAVTSAEPSQSRCRCGRGEPSSVADVAGVSPLPEQMWQGRAQSRGGCDRCEPSPSTEWESKPSRRRCGRGEPSPSADVGK